MDLKDNVLQVGSCIITGIMKMTKDGNDIDIWNFFCTKKDSRPSKHSHLYTCHLHLVLYILDGPIINNRRHVVIEPLHTYRKFVMAVTIVDVSNVALGNIMNPTIGTMVIEGGKHIGNAIDFDEELEDVENVDVKNSQMALRFGLRKKKRRIN